VNFCCNLWEPYSKKVKGSCLDKLDHTQRVELEKLQNGERDETDT
jgi:hypothetical protein